MLTCGSRQALKMERAQFKLPQQHSTRAWDLHSAETPSGMGSDRGMAQHSGSLCSQCVLPPTDVSLQDVRHNSSASAAEFVLILLLLWAAVASCGHVRCEQHPTGKGCCWELHVFRAGARRMSNKGKWKERVCVFSVAAQGWLGCPKSHRVPTDPSGTPALLTVPALPTTHPSL